MIIKLKPSAIQTSLTSQFLKYNPLSMKFSKNSLLTFNSTYLSNNFNTAGLYTQYTNTDFAYGSSVYNLVDKTRVGDCKTLGIQRNNKDTNFLVNKKNNLSFLIDMLNYRSLMMPYSLQFHIQMMTKASKKAKKKRKRRKSGALANSYRKK